MKVEQTTLVDYDEVDSDFRMKLPVLFQRFQRAALHHSEAVGLGSQAMVAAGAVWVLNRMCVEITRMPRYRETITVRTWHTGSAGFRAGREFVMLCGGEQLAAATSRWLYYDLKRKRIAKIPGTVSDPYTTETQAVLAADAIDFKVDKTFVLQASVILTTRESDFDPNGHVNNAVYLDYLDTLMKRTGMASGDLCHVGIHYLKEIGRGIDTLQAGVARCEAGLSFRFFDRSAVYAAGFVSCHQPA